ncbi:ATP synthase subunit C lysine N-methyltransferase-like [Clytia hemisphaerica]|uniref:Uncharacterized protein n=1 Tax=Clytia hemisphaerica TaxID=252671 RepID=A0A7M5X2K9_9CNID
MYSKIYAATTKGDTTILQQEQTTPGKAPRSKLALTGLAITGGLAVGVSLVTFSFVSPALRRICLPFVPATDNQISNVLKLCKKKQGGGGSLVDLGSGDGRIVFSAAKNGYQATGYELNPWLVLYSKISARMQNLWPNAKFERKDLWKVDYKQFDNIVIFGVADMMNELSIKLENDMDDNCRVIACRFEIPRWKPVKEIQDGIDSTWLYTRESFNRTQPTEDTKT